MKTFALAASILLFLAYDGNAQCMTEDESLDTCMTTAGTGDVAKEACDVCVVAAAGSSAAIGTVTCDDLANGDGGLCVALNLCPCPESCVAEVGAYALCEFNDEVSADCASLSLDCSDAATTTAEDGAATTEDGGAVTTEAPPATTEAPPTADPTSATSLTFTKMGVVVAGVISSIYLL